MVSEIGIRQYSAGSLRPELWSIAQRQCLLMENCNANMSSNLKVTKLSTSVAEIILFGGYVYLFHQVKYKYKCIHQV